MLQLLISRAHSVEAGPGNRGERLNALGAVGA
jgi:hypothetical protein